MNYTYDHDYHIHTRLSSCSGHPEQTPARILDYARENNLTRVCVTDHYWDSAVPGASDWYRPQDFDHIRASLPLPTAEGIELLFGCETDMDRNFRLGLPRSRYEDFDFIIVPTTHMHMTGFTISEEDARSNVRRGELWVRRLDALLSHDLPFGKVGIAHLACGLINRGETRDGYLETMNSISDADMERLFKRAAELGCGIELNKSDMNYKDGEEDTVLRPFRIAKAEGCKFYLGTDAHTPQGFSGAGAIFERAIKRLGLCECDKFHILGN